MEDIEVSLIAKGRKRLLCAEPTIVPASEIVIQVSGSSHSSVYLDGMTKHLRSTGGMLPLDLKRSTGYHRLTVGTDDFWFATVDAKASLEGITEMLSELEGLGTGWKGQIVFSNSEGLRDPHVVYGWLDLWADRLLVELANIVDQPRSELTTNRALSRRGGAGTDVPATLRLIRSDPNRFLEEHPTGILTVGETRYMPQRVMLQRRRSTVDTSANRRVVRLAALLRRLANEVYEAADKREQQTRALMWRNKADKILASDVAQRLLRYINLPDNGIRSEIERTDPRYELVHRLLKETDAHFGWAPTSQLNRRYSFVQKSDEIYEAYCASKIAQTFGLKQTDAVLGRVQPAFAGKDLNLYLNAAPPRDVLRSWRSFSVSPDTSRPDILLHSPTTGKVAVIDAKYRENRGEASEDSRKEVSAYMALYGLDRIGIAFPGSGEVRTISAQMRSIVELPVSPSLNNRDELRSAVDGLFVSPTFPTT